MSDERLEIALRDMEMTANNFAVRLVRMAEVRSAYLMQIRGMSQSIRQAVAAGELSIENGAKLANEMRNQIVQTQRARDLDLGRALARRLKDRGLTLTESITKAMAKMKVEGRSLTELTGDQQRQVLTEVIEASGRSSAPPRTPGGRRVAKAPPWLAGSVAASLEVRPWAPSETSGQAPWG
jgi:hypothetical protein